MIRRLMNLAQGQVRVQVTGASLTRFLNLCAQQELVLRHMRRTGWNELYATLSVADFRALQSYMGRTGCRVHIVKRMGAPFHAARLRPRYALWGGGVLFCLLCYLLTSRVWAIDKHIAPGLHEATLMAHLEDLGVKIGVPRRSIDVKHVRWQMFQRMPDLSFITLNVQGNRLTIEAEKKIPIPEVLDENAVVKIVAQRDGVITNMRIHQGAPLVKVGDAVLAGDILVSGLVPPTTERGKYHLTHAQGIIEARTSYEITRKRPLETQKKSNTGKTQKQYALLFGKKRVNLYLGSGIPGDTCDKIVDIKSLWLSDSVVFPVSLVVQEYRYYDSTPVVATPADLQPTMTDRVLSELAQKIEGQVADHRETIAEEGGAAVLHLTASAVEQIGTEALDNSAIPPESAQPETETNGVGTR